MTPRPRLPKWFAAVGQYVLLAFVGLACWAGYASPSKAGEPAIRTDPSLIKSCACGSRCSCLSAWANDECRLLCRDDCYRPKTLFAWSGQERNYVNGTQDEPLVSDRPDFTEASSCVGLRRVQVEMGYTYIRDNNNATVGSAHSFPETLLRVGMFAEWFEARVAWNYGIHLDHTGIVSNIFQGGDDLYLGAKLALTEQDGWRPEMALVPQMNVPTGPPEVSDGEVEPGVNWLYGWDVNEWLAMGGSTQVNRALDDADVFYAEFAQSWTFNYTLTEKLGAYTEWFAFFPAGSVVALPEHYFDGGFIYLAHKNVQYDIRAGVGLNDPADDFFGGVGAVLRF
ncbi:MAG: transporter [Pirellulales bacterium]